MTPAWVTPAWVTPAWVTPAWVTPAWVTPAWVTPAWVTPAWVTPAWVTPAWVTPAWVTPAWVTPAWVTPAWVTPAWVTPAWVTPAWVTPAWVTPAWVTPAWVTPEGVFNAAETLQRQGRHPSLRAVRDYIGGGSFGDIVPLLQAWRKQKTRTDPVKQQTVRPSPRLVSALAQLAAITTEIAEAPMTSAQQTVDKDSLSTTQIQTDLSQLQQLAKDQMSRLHKDPDELYQQNLSLSQQLLHHKQEIISQQEIIETLSKDLNDLIDWREKVMSFLKQLSQ